MPDTPTLPEIVPSGERMIYLVRSDTNPARQHRELRSGDWVDSFANNQISISEQLEKG